MSASSALRPSSLAVLALLAAPLSSQITFPVQATVKEQGKPPATVKIGDLSARPQTGSPSKGVFADFKFEPSRGKWLDQWYDFRWINIERFYIVNGANRQTSRLYGPLPAVAPQSFMHPNGNDDEPFHHHYTEWLKMMRGLVTIREEGKFVQVSADVQGEPAPTCVLPCKTEVHFETYLVAIPVSGTGAKANEMQVITGFEWEYETTLSSQGQQLHKATLSSEIAPADGVTQINRALANATPAFTKPSAATQNWVAVLGGPLTQCPKRVGFNTQPGVGMPEGHYMVASSNGGPGNPGGVFALDPSGARPPMPITGLPAAITGVGAPAGIGANTLALTGPGANAMFIGTIVAGSLAPPFHQAELHRVRVDDQGQVVSDEVLDTIPSGGAQPVGYLDLERIHGDRCREPEDCEDDDSVCAYDDGNNDGGSPLRVIDGKTGQVTEIPIAGALPQGTLREIAVDPTGSTVFLAIVLTDGSGFATGSGDIVAVPIAGGAPRTVATVSVIPDLLETDTRNGTLHLLGFDLGTFQTKYLTIDPASGAVTTVATVSSNNFRMAFEEATGEFVLMGTNLGRLSASGVETVGRPLFSANIGLPNDLDVVPSPVVYGRGTPSQFGVYWDFPPVRPGGGGLADLPIEGNQSFAISASTNGYPIVGAVGLALRPASGIQVLGVNLLIDPATTLVFVPVAGTPTAVLRLPLPDGLGPVSLYAQMLFLKQLSIGSTDGLKITFIEN